MIAAQFFEFDEQQLAFKQQIDRFVDKEIRPHVAQWENDKVFPQQVFKQLAALDCLNIGFKAENGGFGGMTELLLLVESLASSGASGMALGVYVHMALACGAIEELGNEAQKERYLTPGMRGEKIGCWAYAEPNAGADVTAVQCSAKADGDDFIINGSKLYITNGPFADFVVLVARTTNDKGLKGISLFIVDKDTPGFTSNVMDKVGMHSSEMAELVFDDCRVPKSALLGPLDGGFRAAIKVLSLGRVIASAFCCGMSQLAIEQTVEHVSNRTNHGRPITDNQFIRFTLADMKVRLEAARLMTYSAAKLIDQGKPFDHECSISKLFASEANTWICERALHLHGAQGYMMESDVQRLYRDCKVLEFGEGTSEIQREMISAAMLSR